MALRTPYIPEKITVHLGAPASNAENVTVPFADYIKNVASSEIYPSWNESAVRANIYAQISYALNRVYLEYYRSRGYNFDITNSTAIDQSFVNGRNIFDNIDRIVSEIFNIYIRREENLEPLAAKYCNGTTTTCEGLSQWGSQGLAEQGYGPFDILQYYYGSDIVLDDSAPIQNANESYPGSPLRLGGAGGSVKTIQTELNRISQNYPLIGKINPVNGVFDETTESAVKTFQGIFNLQVDGIVGKATWYKLVNIYVGVARLSELNAEGIRFFLYSLEYPEQTGVSAFAEDGALPETGNIDEGSKGQDVEIVQYFLSVIGTFYDTVPVIAVTGHYGSETVNAVKEFQKTFRLPETGEVDAETWNMMYNAFRGIADAVFIKNEIFAIDVMPFGGTVLELGSAGDEVTELQEYLTAISMQYLQITPLNITGYFGGQTENAVKEYQRLFGLDVTGKVAQADWNSIINTYKNIVSAGTSRPVQFPGKTLSFGDTDAEVRS